MLVKIPLLSEGDIDPDKVATMKECGQWASVTCLTKGVYVSDSFNPQVRFPHVKHNQRYDPWPEGLYNVGEGIEHNFGVCDNVHQVFETFPMLKGSERKFAVTLTPVYRAAQPETRGWQYKDWGPYIGDKKHGQYLFDDKHIEMVYVFHIFEVINVKKEKENERTHYWQPESIDAGGLEREVALDES